MLINVFASGTNIQRIAKNANGNNIDGVLDVAYSQLEQTEEDFVKRKFYSLQYNGLNEHLEAEFKKENMPNWSKIWAKPLKCRSFLTTMFNGIVGSDDMLAGVNLSAAAEEDITGIMVFTSADNAPMNKAADMLDKELTDWLVVALNGEAGQSNRTAQQEIRNQIKQAKEDGKKGIIIISNIMGSRSFSIPEIQASVIMYDRGSIDATAQKVSRCLTPGGEWDGKGKTTGHIFSFSFDANRNEVIENIVLYESTQVARSENISVDEAVKFVFRSVNIFNVDVDGDSGPSIRPEQFLDIYGDNDNLLKIADITVKVDNITDEAFDALSNIIATKDPKTAKKLETLTPKAKGKQAKNNTPSDKSDEEKAKKQIEKIFNEAIRTINRSASTVYNLVMDGTGYRDCLVNVSNNSVAALEFKEFYGIAADDAIMLVDNEVLNTPLLDIIVHNSQYDGEEF